MYSFIITGSWKLTASVTVPIYIFTPPVHGPELGVAKRHTIRTGPLQPLEAAIDQFVALEQTCEVSYAMT